MAGVTVQESKSYDILGAIWWRVQKKCGAAMGLWFDRGDGHVLLDAGFTFQGKKLDGPAFHTAKEFFGADDVTDDDLDLAEKWEAQLLAHIRKSSTP